MVDGPNGDEPFARPPHSLVTRGCGDMESGERELHWGPEQLPWTQVGMKMGPHWHEGGVRWVGLQTCTWHGKTIQVGHIWRQKPHFVNR